jgi:hypothetical protein
MTHICNKMVNAIVPAVEEVAVATRKEATDEFAGQFQKLSEGLQLTQKVLVNQYQETNFNKMKDKYNDFETYSQEARELARKRGFDIEEAYHIVKGKKVSEGNSQREVGSERPTHSFLRERKPSSDRTSSTGPADESRDGRGGRTLSRASGKTAFRGTLLRGMKNAGINVA